MAEPRSPRPQGGAGRRPLSITMDAVWASPAAGKGPREPGGWLSTVRATARREGALSETPQGELTREKYRMEPVPHGGCRPGCAPGSCARGPGVPGQWLFLPRSCPASPGTVSCCPSGTLGVWDGWPWPGFAVPSAQRGHTEVSHAVSVPQAPCQLCSQRCTFCKTEFAPLFIFKLIYF